MNEALSDDRLRSERLAVPSLRDVSGQLDLYGAHDLPQVLSGVAQRKSSLTGKAESKQLMIPDTDHFFADREEAMIKVVKDFLDGVK